jgi:N-methylhydantoinase A
MRIGVDIGGTFTDFVIYHPNTRQVDTFKLLSTPHNPAEAMLEGLSRISYPHKRQIIHGSTVATNALLERKGAKTALVTTQGFKDVLQIGRQNRPSLYDWSAAPPEPLVPGEWRYEVGERVSHQGEIIMPLDEDQLPALANKIKVAGIESVAVCLLFSFLKPAHEETIRRVLENAGVFISISSQVLPTFREFERTSTTVTNAYVSPVMDRYLADLESRLSQDNLQIMQSNGGSIQPDVARAHAVRCILSGPAGGAVGAEAISTITGFKRLLTFDMGGTSTDVSLIDGRISTTSEASVGGFPLGIPMIDIHTVGSGGGSIAHVDAGGALRVGPQSAGADPGPACYGNGHLPTVTDANLVLGRLSADYFLGGKMHLKADWAVQAVSQLGEQLHLSPEETALGIIQVANAHMERALRVISVERGHDPREFSLLSFGGAGGLHAADLARGLAIPTVLVPPHAATFSAFGMIMTDVIKDYSRTVMLPGSTPLDIVKKQIDQLDRQARSDLANESIPPDQIRCSPSLDLRYKGQSFELTVPFSDDCIQGFHQLHHEIYGFSDADGEVQIVNLRLKATGLVPSPEVTSYPNAGKDSSVALVDTRPVALAQGKRPIPFYLAEKLKPGNQIPGPAVILRPDTTILVEAPDYVRIDPFLNLIITVGQND